jgi:hypothetical protein
MLVECDNKYAVGLMRYVCSLSVDLWSTFIIMFLWEFGDSVVIVLGGGGVGSEHDAK